MAHQPDTWLELSRSAAVANAATIRALINPGVILLSVIKANGYGHGLVPMAKILKQHIDWFGVFTLDEAIELRSAGIRNPVLVLGRTNPVRFAQAKRLGGVRLTLCLAEELRRVPQGLAVHIKVDTGLSRLGVPAAEFEALLANAPRSLNIEGIYSHLADAENFKDDSYTHQQFVRFENALAQAAALSKNPELTHILASDGILRFPEQNRQLVRCGILLYGLWPNEEFEKRYGTTVPLRPVLSFKSRLMSIKTIPKGTKVGYAVTERVKRDSRVAVVPVGYRDGYGRTLSSNGVMLVRGVRCKVLGRISMNMTVIDITAVPAAAVGDEVVLIGRQLNAEITALELARLSGTITYEVVTRINPLIPRIYVN